MQDTHHRWRFVAVVRNRKKGAYFGWNLLFRYRLVVYEKKILEYLHFLVMPCMYPEVAHNINVIPIIDDLAVRYYSSHGLVMKLSLDEILIAMTATHSSSTMTYI